MAALDQAKLSDGMAIHVLIAAAQALGHNVSELVINRTSFRDVRKATRAQESQKIHADFLQNVI